MRAAILLVLAVPAMADGIAKAQAIAKAGPEAARAAIPELIELGKGSPAERFAARDALVVAGPPAVAKLIVEAGGNPSLRLLLEGVSFDVGAGVVVAALPALASEDQNVRAMAAVSLGAAGAGGAAAVKMLDAALYDADVGVRRESALALGGIGLGARDGIAGLIHLANDPERGLTREALLALGMILRDAAERERPAPKPSPEVARAIESGLAWLSRQQRPDGSWEVPPAGDAPAAEKVRACVASLALLAMLEGGDPNRRSPELRPGLRYVVATDGSSGEYAAEGWSVAREAVVATLCAAARVLGEPECRVAAERGLTTLAARAERNAGGENAKPGLPAWAALPFLEAGFAGLCAADSGTIAEFQALIASSPKEANEDPPWLALVARAQWYGGADSHALVESVLKLQREDGSWASTNALGPVHATACMLLCLEAASGLTRPLTLPLPDAPQLKAAVATLKIARQSKDGAIRAAAEQALAGFR